MYELETLYRESTGPVRGTFGKDIEQALEHYSPLVRFINGISPCGRLLDVGCGSGWSTFAFSRAGYDAIGLDLNSKAFEVPPESGLALCEGSAQAIPFADDFFDLVVIYQCLEHIPEPQRVLDEMSRVCKPRGIVAVVGPNLVSPFPGLRYLVRPSSWRLLSFRRKPGMPRHPYGNTVTEIVGTAPRRAVELGAKILRRTPRFTMREPDVLPPFNSDNDACYLCCPSDLIAYFRSNRWRIERRGKPGRPWPSYLFAGGTWVAARKPLVRCETPKSPKLRLQFG